jgi:CDP-4-dehydro-6-deoxyglucose reductase
MNNNLPTKRLQVTLAALRRASSRTLVLQLRFSDGEALQYRPGQFVGLDGPDGRQRLFSIANAAAIDNQIELHVNRAPGGLFTGLLFDQAQIGDRFWLEGPFGAFSIPPDAPRRSILVAGGTGFAPIKACLEQMAAARPAGADPARLLHLYWGARTPEDLYDLAGLAALSERLPHLRVTPVLDQGHPASGARTGFVHRAVIDDFEDLSDYDIYACGAPAMIEALSRECAAERGFDPARLTADIFVAGPGDGGLEPVAAGAPIALFLDRPSRTCAIEGVEGEALLFALKRAGVALPAVCGGKGACGTCRIHVLPPWRSRIAEPARREARLLDYIGAGEGDRLSCRILLTADLDGLELQTCADSQGDAQ